MGGDEASAQLNSMGPQCQGGNVSPGIYDAPGGDDRDGNGIGDLGHQDTIWNLVGTADPTSLIAFGNDNIYTLGLGTPGVPYRGYLMEYSYLGCS